MVQPSRPHRRLSALLALIVGLFVLAPLAEAVACGPEQGEAAAAVLSLDADVEEADDCCPPGQGCSQGHCHAPITLPPVALEAPHVWATAARMGAPPGLRLVSTMPDGLIRPPRA